MCCHQHPDNGSDLAMQNQEQITEQEHIDGLEAVNTQLLEALEEAQIALLSAILFIEGAFPEPRSDILKQELTSYRMREVKARAAIDAAKESE